MTTGAFSDRAASKKKWKVNEHLLAALQTVLPAQSTIMDLGAGAGMYVCKLRELGHTVEGVDGTPAITRISNGIVRCLDLTSLDVWSKVYNSYWRPDVALFIEVGEHVPAEHAVNLLDNVANAAKQLLVVSWAVPGQRGRGHVNCQPPEWVACEFGKRHWTLDAECTAQARAIAGRGWNKKLLVLRKQQPNK